MASVTLEHEDGLELAEIDLVPPEHRPRRTRSRGSIDGGQLQQIREAVRRLAAHGADFVAGDLGRFVAHARPVPPHKRC